MTKSPKRKRPRKPREWWCVLYPDGVVYSTRASKAYAESDAAEIDAGEIVKVREVLRAK